MNFTLEQISAFALTAKHGSFKKAADILGKHRTSVSNLVANLEDEINYPLFIRGSRSLDITEEGKFLLSNANAILKECELFDERTKKDVAKLPSKITIAALTVLKNEDLFSIIHYITNKYPFIELELLFGDPLQVLAWTSSGQADIGISINTSIFPQELILSPLFNWKTQWVIHPNIIPEMENDTSLAWLRNLPQVIYNHLDKKIGQVSNHTYTVNDVSAAIEMVKAQLGWSIIPKCMGTASIKNHDLIEIAGTQDLGEFIQFSAYWHSDIPLNPVSNDLLKSLQNLPDK